MPRALEPAAVAVRLRRLWLGEVAASPELADSDLGDAWRDVLLRRVAGRLVLSTPYDFGAGDPLVGAFGDLLRGRVAELSGGAVTEVTWEYDSRTGSSHPRKRSSDLDVYAPGDPVLAEYPGVLADLRRRLDGTPFPAREALGRLRLVGVSRHRLWFAASSRTSSDAIGTVPGARAALVTAVQGVQRHEVPLYRVVVDASYRRRSMLL